MELKVRAPAPSSLRSASSPKGYRPVVMMVEDDPDDRRIYGTVLYYNGFNVVLVPDGGSAKRVVSLIRPDLIVLDLGLPDVSGLSLCRELKSATDAPIVVVSGLSRRVMGVGASAMGCSLYIEKPTSPVLVLHRIEDFLGRPPAPGEGSGPWVISFPFPDGEG